MSKESHQRPEVKSNDHPLPFVSFVEEDYNGSPRKLCQYYYQPIDEKGRDVIDFLFEEDKNDLSPSESTLFKAYVGRQVSREIPLAETSGRVKVAYDLPQWLVPMKIHAKKNGFVHINMQFPSLERIAHVGYSPDGKLAGAMLFHDKQSIDSPETKPARSETRKDTAAFIKGDQIYFYEDKTAHDNEQVERSERLAFGMLYLHRGDRYKLDIDTAGYTMITETVRENGRRRIVAFPMDIGTEACSQLRDPQSFYWAQIPWLEDVRVEIGEAM